MLQKKRKKRSKWVKDWKLNRNFSDIQLLRELEENNPDDYRNYLRMDSQDFKLLLELIGPKIEKQNTVMRMAITAEERLIATLRFLATGRSYEDLKFSTCISAPSLSYIIPETCKEIFEALKKDYMKFPTSKEEWQDISIGFQNRWQFVNCGGSIDGKHIRILQPPGTGAQFYNYKGFYSIVLMAVVNSNYEFIYVDVGKNGRLSDGGVIECTEFYKSLKEEKLQIPNNDDTVNNLNFVFLGDEAFALHEHILKPYSQRELTHEKRVFNYRLSRARNCVENTFGLISSRFRLLQRAINLNPEKASYAVLAICAIHNFLRKRGGPYVTSTMFDRQEDTNILKNGEWRENINNELLGLQCTRQKNVSTEAKVNRDNYMHFFNNQGSVDFQEDMVKAGRA
ncbi:unnamed protein product [Macrosiphum euphorbiae]|uniref:DDE Tnp4 domain-containing protein n=1 Tax=Macrosiphum euphorbiae TaxID=13131 RepID=A0AAV0VQ93_9HEMI|nr:unnamed protein product [Macrosiphum euphorbiae]